MILGSSILKTWNQVIRKDLKTPYSALTPAQYIEYTDMEMQLYIADRQKKKYLKKLEQQRKIARNPLAKLVCFCGLV